MKNRCISCVGSELQILDTIKKNDLLTLYNKMNIDVKNELEGIDIIEVHKCNTCQLIFFSPQIMGSEKMYEQLQQYSWYYMDEKYEYKYAKKYIKKSHEVLEIGSGKGVFAEKITCANYIGLEFNQKAIDEAEKKGIRLIKQSIEEFSKTYEKKYDVVCSFQVLEHVNNVRSFIQSAVKSIKSEGIMIIAVPSIESKIVNMENHILNLPPHHMTWWTDQALEKLGEDSGMEIVAIEHEPISNVHKITYKHIIVRNKMKAWLGIKDTVINDTKIFRVIDRVAYYISRLLGNLIPIGNELGHAVIAVYRKKL